MTDSTILLEDVQKMKDKGEIAQAYIGLKETNRWVAFFIHFGSVMLIFSLQASLLYSEYECLCIVLLDINWPSKGIQSFQYIPS